MSFLKKPLSKNLCLSLTGKEPFLNSLTVHNDFPIGLMIISKLDQISARIDVDKHLSKEQIEELEVETKLKYINQHARDLFELKDNDSSSKISEQLKQFKLSIWRKMGGPFGPVMGSQPLTSNIRLQYDREVLIFYLPLNM